MSLGVCNRSGTGQAVNGATHADLVIGIGTHLNDLNTAGWSFYDFADKQKLIHIDIDITEIGRNYPTEVGLFADAKKTLRALVDAWEDSGYQRSGTEEWLEQIANWKKEWQGEN